MPKEFACPSCGKTYETSGGLRKHFRKFVTHKSDVKDSGPLQASKAVGMFLNVNDLHRKARLKELARQLTEDEIHEIFLPKLSQSISLHELAVEKAKCSVRKDNISVVKLWTEMQHCVDVLKQKHPELEVNINNKGNIKLASFIDDHQISRESLKAPQLVLGKEHNIAVTNYVVNSNNSQVLKDVIMPAVLEKNREKFVEFSTGLATNFNISQSKYQNVLRNELGKELMDTLGVNIIVPKDTMVKEVDNLRKEIQETLQLKFIEKDGIVAACTNVRQTVEWLLSKESLSQAISLPNDHIIIYHYADAFPWMQWSKFFTGETSIRIKLVEPHNLLSTIATVCTWLGPDDYDHMSTLGGDVFSQLDNLKVYHPILRKPIKVSVRGVADGSQRRSATGNSSASSTYPIPEAPERSDQLGDMTIICQNPLSSIPAARIYIKVLACSKEEILSTLLNSAPELQPAISSGLQPSYKPQVRTRHNPECFFPLVHDPTLVRAAQLALLHLLDCHQDLLWTVKMYKGLKASFDTFLRLRILQTKSVKLRAFTEE